jgi:hypothetical protein
LCLSERKKDEAGENVILMRFIICTYLQISFRWSKQGGDMDGERRVHGVENKYAQTFERESKSKGKTLNA